MKVSVSQIYIKAGVSFPFSHHMQRLLGEEFSGVSQDDGEFVRKHGGDFDLVINLSADVGIGQVRVKGPTVFKKTRDVEYTLFLPFDVIVGSSDGCRSAVEFLVEGVRTIFRQAGIDTARLHERQASIVEQVCSNPIMLSRPWPWSH
jgi:hypothetical protein